MDVCLKNNELGLYLNRNNTYSLVVYIGERLMNVLERIKEFIEMVSSFTKINSYTIMYKNEKKVFTNVRRNDKYCILNDCIDILENHESGRMRAS